MADENRGFSVLLHRDRKSSVKKLFPTNTRLIWNYSSKQQYKFVNHCKWLFKLSEKWFFHKSVWVEKMDYDLIATFYNIKLL